MKMGLFDKNYIYRLKSLGRGRMPKTIRILNVMYNPSFILKNKYIIPIQAGRALKPPIEGVIGDDTGNNISQENPFYCELTALYWEWKNSHSDYVGLFHYRRHLSFNTEKPFPQREIEWGSKSFICPDEKYFESTFLKDEEKICNLVCDYDLILPDKFKVTTKNNYNFYKGSAHHHIADLDKAFAIIEEKYPSFSKYVDDYKKDNRSYFCLMFIMRRDLFEGFCEWLFPILEELKLKIDFTSYSPQEARVIGYVAERLLDVYIRYLIAEKPNLKVKELQRTFIKNPNSIEELKPFYSEKNIGIVLSMDRHYLPYFSVLLENLKETSSPENNYDIIVVHEDLLAKDLLNVLLDQIKNFPHFSLRFLNISSRSASLEMPKVGHFTRGTYLRLLIPEVLNAYEKIVYLDVDIVVKKDIAELHNIDLENNYLGAVQDLAMLVFLKFNKLDFGKIYNGSVEDYLKKYLNFQETSQYFNAGVLLLNLKKMRESHLPQELLKTLSEKTCKFVDQDILNSVFNNKGILFLDRRWNVFTANNGNLNTFWKELPLYYQNEYLFTRADPYIIHYIGPKKPWSDYEEDFAPSWWENALKSPMLPLIYKKVFTPKNSLKKTKDKGKLNFLFPENSRRRRVVRAVIKKVKRFFNR